MILMLICCSICCLHADMVAYTNEFIVDACISHVLIEFISRKKKKRLILKLTFNLGKIVMIHATKVITIRSRKQ